MKRQVNAAAKISDREARITFVLIHMISEYHILAEQCTKPDGENNLFRFVLWCLSRFCDELELPADGEFTNPIERSAANTRRNAETGQAYRPRGWHPPCISRERITKKVRYLSILTFLSGLLHFITLQNISLRLVFYTLGNQSEILIIQGILERNYTFFRS